MKKSFIYADLNSMSGNKIPLKNPRLKEEIVEIYGKCELGLEVYLWTDDADKNGKYDPLIYIGNVTIDKNGDFFIETNPKKMEHLSTSDQFKDYSLQDVIGHETYEKEKKNHPELF